jgi:hypothetical protein
MKINDFFKKKKYTLITFGEDEIDAMMALSFSDTNSDESETKTFAEIVHRPQYASYSKDVGVQPSV